MSDETIAVPVALLRELAERRQLLGRETTPYTVRAVIAAIDMLPSPKPDPVAECCNAYATCGGSFERGVVSESRLRAALRCYRKILGLTPDPELDK